MKACRKCGVEKPLADYYTHKQMADGHLNICKECVKARAREHRRENLERIREYDRKRGQTEARKKRVREYYRKTVATKEGRDRLWDQSREWARKNKERRAAHIAVTNAVRNGTLKPKPCERCSFPFGVHGHHEDYSKPLDVIWLCRRCHGERHREINEERRRKAA